MAASLQDLPGGEHEGDIDCHGQGGAVAPDATLRPARSGGPRSRSSAQTAITAWVHTCNHARPHQALDLAVPANFFRPGKQV
jgi:hypothetical protein